MTGFPQAAEELVIMPGGARNRSGPQPDPMSGRSARRDITLIALPAEGFTGEVPPWPMARQSDREADLWAWAWTTPQAAAWSIQPWRWHSVAMWVRVASVCEGPRAQAADKNGLHRFADQIGLTPAGLKENGWKIAAVDATKPAVKPKRARRPAVRRLSAVPDA